MAANVIKMKPGPTRMAVSLVQDIRSSFELFIPDSIQHIILDCANLEGRRVLGGKWKEMDQTTLWFLSLLEFSCPGKNSNEVQINKNSSYEKPCFI